jgi:hypothetical protein
VDSLEQNKERKMDMRFGTGNARTGSPETVASELVKYKLDLIAVPDLRRDKGGSQPAEINAFFCGILYFRVRLVPLISYLLGPKRRLRVFWGPRNSLIPSELN